MKQKKEITQRDIINYLNFLKKQPKGFVYKNSMQKKENKKTKQQLVETLYSKYKNCKNCPLCNQGRTQVVFGKGNPNTKLMFVGEGPGRDEDLQGAPFVGKSGKLLTKIIEAMGLKREDVFISNVVKCRPPNNRAPLPDESEICKNLLLLKEIEIIKPKIICMLGASATTAILGPQIRISQARGNFFEFNNILVMPTFHPAYLLRNPKAKMDVWEDMKKIISKLSEN
ncbi:MAG: uracil-DNA glycosylase [bacterium]